MHFSMYKICFIKTMFRNRNKMAVVNKRTFKNFGHKRQPIPAVTTLWHGFLTFTFIGLGIEWKRIKTLLFGLENGDILTDASEDNIQEQSQAA